MTTSFDLIGRRLRCEDKNTSPEHPPLFDLAQDGAIQKLRCSQTPRYREISMSIVDTIPVSVPQSIRPSWLRSNWGLLFAVVALIAALLMPTPDGLSIAGHRMLAVLLFAVIVWMTEALDYAVSAVVIAALMAFLLGLSPNPANPKVLLGKL
jgi:hypothetical protein